MLFGLCSLVAEKRKQGEFALVLQAGVALGLARMVGVRFSSWGPQFQTLAVSAIILNLCVGPPLFRAAIISMGEGRPGGRKPELESPPAKHRERTLSAKGETRRESTQGAMAQWDL
jgi:hypothetical protein